MPYRPGDFWRICDLSGKKVLASQTRKTWDGLIVYAPLWYPKHPQLSIRGIPDRQNVPEPRPRPADLSIVPLYGWGSFCLTSPNGTDYVVYVDDDGALLVREGTWGTPQPALILSGHKFTVDDDGALHVVTAGLCWNVPLWRMYSPSRICFELSIDIDLAVHLTIVSGPAYMEGVFTLISPDGTNYVVYIVDDMAVLVVTGSWGPASTNFYLGNYTISAANDGALLAVPSGENFPPTYRMVSTGGYEYMWHIDPDGAVKIERQGHWWDVPVLVSRKSMELPFTVTDQVTESGQEVWVEE